MKLTDGQMALDVVFLQHIMYFLRDLLGKVRAVGSVLGIFGTAKQA